MMQRLTEVQVAEFFLQHKETLLREMEWEILKNRKRDRWLRLSHVLAQKRREGQKIKWAIEKCMRDLGLNYLEASSIIDTEFLERLGY